MNCIESAELSWHRLCSAFKYGRIDFDDIERRDKRQDRSTPLCHLLIAELDPQTQAIERPQAFGQDQSAGNALFNLPPFRKRVGLT